MTKGSFFENRTLPLKEFFEDDINLKDYKVFPSLFQRGYCWSDSTALNFIRAVAVGETLNAGTIVLAHDPQNKTIEIVDGQQRLYTLLLFYKAFSHGNEVEDLNSFLPSFNRKEKKKNNNLIYRRRSSSQKISTPYVKNSVQMKIGIRSSYNDSKN